MEAAAEQPVESALTSDVLALAMRDVFGHCCARSFVIGIPCSHKLSWLRLQFQIWQ